MVEKNGNDIFLTICYDIFQVTVSIEPKLLFVPKINAVYTLEDTLLISALLRAEIFAFIYFILRLLFH